MPVFILSEANLGLLGLGVSEPLPSWGALLRELENYSAVLQESLDAGAGRFAGGGGQLSAAVASNRGARRVMLMHYRDGAFVGRRFGGERGQ